CYGCACNLHYSSTLLTVLSCPFRSCLQNQLSGYLLRKFKNSNGWQKLWVVFTNFCLFFYKTHQDDFPLASLPLLGYTVSSPGESDSIHKEYVFKLQFKSHVYFFRAESEYTFERYSDCSHSLFNSFQQCVIMILEHFRGHILIVKLGCSFLANKSVLRRWSGALCLHYGYNSSDVLFVSISFSLSLPLSTPSLPPSLSTDGWR
uniref:PH domain-containing protein n=1 Tax=Hucho hucho TaxID=62062 RepID=A0A4W5LIA6_9TELE